MKILHLAPYFAPAYSYGGVVSAAQGLATAQAVLNHAVSALTTDTLTPTERLPRLFEMIDGVTIYRCRNQWGALRRLNLSSPVRMGATFDNIPADVIHCHELRTVENLIVTPRAAARKLPIILSPHGTLPLGTGRSTIKRGWDRAFGKGLAARFGGIIALTENEAADARQLWESSGLTAPPIAVIPNGVTLPETWRFKVRPYHVPYEGSFNLLFLGRLHERKGVQLLIPAFARAALPNARLIIAGPDEGMLRTLQKLAAECGVADRVVFAGYVSGRAREALIAGADLFVLPAEGEGLSMSALEAMAAGVPVILTPGCNLPEAEHRGAGVIVPRKVEALSGAITSLMSDPARRARAGIAARAWMGEAFGWGAVAARVIGFYERVGRGETG